MTELIITSERFPIRGRFTIARGSKTEAAVVTVELRDGAYVGRGECVPYGRYGESVEGVVDQLAALEKLIAEGLRREDLMTLLPPGAARNALDCAMWDIEAKRARMRVHEMAGLPAPQPVVTAYTLSLDTPEAMAQAAREAGHELLKLKLGAEGDLARLTAIRAAVPQARLIVDANEGWSADNLVAHLAACAEVGVELVEQPLPADDDALLAQIARPVPVCADESAHGLDSLDTLAGRYDALNIKLDKTGGLTEAIMLARAAQAAGLDIMVGCMVGTSLAMAPALLLTPLARFVDLDGPLLLAADRSPALRYEGSVVYPPEPALWG
ncbi:L-alanine-DL-glutamate epimerase-like enolase superfamily enzyme [Ancylobacter aquaticus]|uniref:Dipeptide epimerase n=1 Tax=Ancylobacter aquaticus TaxID=100 RepID=A0A4R1I7B4_ANCAQ|nr:N-acetyl-D-Glu racemase DgcA [Ancylobacter aquaticus]TCK28629.1 L-alanine-DL-glutamate epimerase-like enolase superfamily enzyme [Ancylobacter aquaticus]